MYLSVCLSPGLKEVLSQSHKKGQIFVITVMGKQGRC